MYRSLLRSLTGDESELVLHFFVAFSWFEYALKQAGFVRRDNHQNAWPDWRRFARERGSSLLDDTMDKELRDAREFLLREPPKRQIVDGDGHLRWRSNERRGGESDAEYLLRLVRDVRNNLFHGGKYPHGAVSGQSLRNSKLLQACLTILEKCLWLVERPKICPVCAATALPDAKFCPKCRATLP